MKALTALERGRATSRLLRHPKLQPYVGKMAPYLPKLAPHAQRILDQLEDNNVQLQIPALIEMLPKLLPYLGTLLDELPHLSPHLHLLLPHRAQLLPFLDRLAPHLHALRPHVGELIRCLPILLPYVPRLIPCLAALLPHLEPLLRRMDLLRPHLSELTSGELLPLLVPHVGTFAAHLDGLAPHLPELLRALREEKAAPSAEHHLRSALPQLLASLAVLLPHIPQLLAQAPRLAERLPSLAGRPEELIAELREHAPRGYYDALDGKRGANGHSEGGEEGGGWLDGFMRFLGGGGGGGEEEGAAVEEVEPAVDLTKVNAAMAGASRRMAALEAEFIAVKQSHAAHLSSEQDAAIRCAKLESTLADVDDGLVALRGKTQRLGQMVEVAELETGAERLMHAREARQIETINGRRDGLFGPPSWEKLAAGRTGGAPAANVASLDERVAHVPPPPPPPPPGAPPVKQQGSMLTRIEDDWLAKLAL